MTIPKIVAQPMTADERRLVVLRLDRELRRRCGELRAADLGGGEGLGPKDQPVGRRRLDVELGHRVLGDHGVGCGSPHRQRPYLLDNRVREASTGGSSIRTIPDAVAELEARDARKARPRAQDVRVRIDLGLFDPEGFEELRRCDVDLSVPVATSLCPVQSGVRRLKGDQLCAEPSRDLLGTRCELSGTCGLHRMVLDRNELTAGIALHNRLTLRRQARMKCKLVRRQVGAGVVEDVAVAGGGSEHDDHRHEHPDTDRRERGARARPIPGEIAQREPGRDRRTAAEARSQRQEERREQDESGDQENNAEHQLWSPATSIPVVRATGVTK